MTSKPLESIYDIKFISDFGFYTGHSEIYTSHKYVEENGFRIFIYVCTFVLVY